jgi:hypothetical protein
MAFGGGDGQPGAPFGGDPFGSNPFGGNPFNTPQVISALPPGRQPASGRSKVLATLSVVFAFVFAPVGALLGHLGLAAPPQR